MTLFPALRRRGALLGAALLVGMLPLASCGSDPTAAAATDRLAGMVRDQPPLLPDVPLFAADGSAVRFRAEPGRVHAWFFGYTACPDVCPTTLADLRAARDLLGADGDRVDVTFVSVDADRDTAAGADAFVQSFVPSARGLVLPPDQLAWVEGLFGATSSTSTDADGRVAVEHTGFLYAVDADGRLTVQWPFGTPAEELATDLRLLLARADGTAAAPSAPGATAGGASAGDAASAGAAPAPLVDPATGGLTYVIPAGTHARQQAGETVSIVPAVIELKVGQPLAIRNDDVVAHTVGPFFADPGTTSRYEFRRPQTVAGECSLHPSGRLEIRVTA